MSKLLQHKAQMGQFESNSAGGKVAEKIQHSSVFFVFFDKRVILKQNTVFDEWTIDYDPRLFV